MCFMGRKLKCELRKSKVHDNKPCFNTVRDSELDLVMFGKIVLGAPFKAMSAEFLVCFK